METCSLPDEGIGGTKVNLRRILSNGLTCHGQWILTLPVSLIAHVEQSFNHAMDGCSNIALLFI